MNSWIFSLVGKVFDGMENAMNSIYLGISKPLEKLYGSPMGPEEQEDWKSDGKEVFREYAAKWDELTRGYIKEGFSKYSAASKADCEILDTIRAAEDRQKYHKLSCQEKYDLVRGGTKETEGKAPEAPEESTGNSSADKILEKHGVTPEQFKKSYKAMMEMNQQQYANAEA